MVLILKKISAKTQHKLSHIRLTLNAVPWKWNGLSRGRILYNNETYLTGKKSQIKRWG
jgi:hypothetical protein